MIDVPQLVLEWQSAEEAAFLAECCIEHVLDEYCSGQGPVPGLAEIARAKRLRFIANHRLRWILFQSRRAQAHAELI